MKRSTISSCDPEPGTTILQVLPSGLVERFVCPERTGFAGFSVEPSSRCLLLLVLRQVRLPVRLTRARRRGQRATFYRGDLPASFAASRSDDRILSRLRRPGARSQFAVCHFHPYGEAALLNSSRRYEVIFVPRCQTNGLASECNQLGASFCVPRWVTTTQ